MQEIQSQSFELTVVQQKSFVVIDQQFLIRAVNTAMLPSTYNVLSASIPTIFNNQCFNYGKLPFSKEVLSTEAGHLFEHLILENLKLETLKHASFADFSGETSWDWNRDKYGKFRISINSPYRNRKTFFRALLKSINIMEEIYSLDPN